MQAITLNNDVPRDPSTSIVVDLEVYDIADVVHILDGLGYHPDAPLDENVQCHVGFKAIVVFPYSKCYMFMVAPAKRFLGHPDTLLGMLPKPKLEIDWTFTTTFLLCAALCLTTWVALYQYVFGG